MRNLVRLGVIAGLLVGGAVTAEAVPDCSSLPNPIYLQVGDTQVNLMKALGRKLRDNAPKPITLIWASTGSCTNIQTIYAHTQIATTLVMSYAPSIAEDPSFVTGSTAPTCAYTVPVYADIGNSAVFNSACTDAAPPANVQLTVGPRQGYVLAMPKGTDQTAITAEEAYFLFGFGPTLLASMNAALSPWLDESQIFIRTNTKSTLLAWAANITVPAAKWHGNKLDGSPMVVSGLTTSPNPSAAIGILGSEVYDGLRASLTVLAFRAFGQYAAYYPDSTVTSRDKKNLRDGHYTVWSPTIWMDYVANGVPVNADARYVIDLIASHEVTPAPSFDATVTIAGVGLVPDCAMRVQRSMEGGPLSLYKPAESCSCKFEDTVDVSTCQTCVPGGTCAAGGVCRNGFCEEF